jgi:hypothetical protein
MAAHKELWNDAAGLRHSGEQGIDMDEPTKEPASRSGPRLYDAVVLFAIKTVIVCAAIVVSSVIMLDYLDDFVGRRMEQMEATLRPFTKMGGKQFWGKLEEELGKQANPASDISPEQKRKILSQIKIISDRWRPFLSEAAASIAGEPSPPPKQ